MTPRPLTLGELGLVRRFLAAIPADRPVSGDLARRLLATMDQAAADRDAVEAVLTSTEQVD